MAECTTHHHACDCREAMWKAELAKLNAELWVAKDAQLRTYDALTTKADKYDETVMHTIHLRDVLQALVKLNKSKKLLVCESTCHCIWCAAEHALAVTSGFMEEKK